MLFEDLDSGSSTDRYAADPVILFANLAAGRSRYRVPHVTEHVKTNLWLAGKIPDAGVEVQGDVVTIDGIGFHATP